MLVLVAAVVVVVVLGGALLLVTGAGAVLRDRVLGASLTVLGVAVGGLVLVVLAVLVGVGARGGGDDGRPEGASPTSTIGSRPAPTATSRAPATDRGSAPAAPARADGDEPLRLVAGAPSDPPTPVPVLDRLTDGEVQHIRAEGLRPGTRGQVRQCHATADGFAACTNAFPVRAGPSGTAVFQYQLRSPNGECGARETCVVVVADGTHTAFAYTVFGEKAPRPARLAVEPAAPYRVGQRVHVTVDGLPPHGTAGLAFCTPRCGAAVRVVADAAGHTRGTVMLRSRCEGHGCAVALVGAGARDTTVAVRFVPAPTPTYEARRILTGLLGAAVLLLLAWFVARRTDWRPPSEAATPQLDTAEL